MLPGVLLEVHCNPCAFWGISVSHNSDSWLAAVMQGRNCFSAAAVTWLYVVRYCSPIVITKSVGLWWYANLDRCCLLQGIAVTWCAGL
jgi:hypothetical protein